MLQARDCRTACQVEPNHKLTNLVVGPARDTRGVDGRNLARRPADGTRSEADRPGPQALRDPQIEGGPGVSARVLDARAPENRFDVVGHVVLPVSVPGLFGNSMAIESRRWVGLSQLRTRDAQLQIRLLFQLAGDAF